MRVFQLPVGLCKECQGKLSLVMQEVLIGANGENTFKIWFSDENNSFEIYHFGS